MPDFDEHHIAIYVGQYSRPLAWCAEHGILTEDRPQQFRFTQIVDPATRAPLYELEHEVRSTYHAGYQRSFVNRNPSGAQFAQ